MSGPFDDLSDEELGRRLAGELPRHAAPAHLRRAVVAAGRPSSARPAWLAPAVAALATALGLGLFFVPMLPRFVPATPTERLVRAAVSEHTRTLMFGPRREIVPAALAELTPETGVTLARAFAGDAQLTFITAEPVYVDRHRGVALHYRDAEGHLVSYIAIAVPAPGIKMPNSDRVQIGRYRPALVRDSGFAAWLWRQGDVACVIVSDRVSDAERETFKDYFMRMRAATEPLPAH
jgi:anti-sigma factor RsiW